MTNSVISNAGKKQTNSPSDSTVFSSRSTLALLKAGMGKVQNGYRYIKYTTNSSKKTKQRSANCDSFVKSTCTL